MHDNISRRSFDKNSHLPLKAKQIPILAPISEEFSAKDPYIVVLQLASSKPSTTNESQKHNIKRCRLTCAREETVKDCENDSACNIVDGQRTENENPAGSAANDRHIDDASSWY